jgi:enterochelin esterase-like enzyme
MLLSLLAILASLVIACDPLAPDPTQVVIVLTPTGTRTPLPTAIPPASETPFFTEMPPLPTDPPTAKVAACAETKGQIINLSFASKVIRGNMRYRVYLPPCYSESTHRFPYVILMHGSDQDEKEWTELLNVQDALESGMAMNALPPMILVMPNGGNQANTNTFREGASFESVIVDELMPDVEKNFCTWNTREGRAIGGISRGGFWAFLIGFRHLELFGAVGGHSPFFDAQNAPAGYNPLSLAKSVQFPPGLQPRIWLDAGRDDYARPNVEVFKKALEARSIDPGYTMNPVGKHEVKYWASHVPEYLSFYGQTWPKNIEDLPSCLQ